MSQYLTHINNYTYRKAFTKFRISAHKFPIESGRYKNVSRENRLCTLCSDNEIGDEFHYFMKCSNNYMSATRQTFLNFLYSLNAQLKAFSDDCIFKYLVGGFDRNLILKTAQYIYDVMLFHSNGS